MLYGKGRMTRSNEGGEILKQDERGRMRVTRERWEALLGEFDRSAMTGRQFAAWAGIEHSTFANLQRLRRKEAFSALPAPEAQQVIAIAGWSRGGLTPWSGQIRSRVLLVGDVVCCADLSAVWRRERRSPDRSQTTGCELFRALVPQRTVRPVLGYTRTATAR